MQNWVSWSVKMEVGAPFSLTLHHYCCFDQTVSGEKSTPSDAYNASCSTLTVGVFCLQNREKRERIACYELGKQRSWLWQWGGWLTVCSAVELAELPIWLWISYMLILIGEEELYRAQWADGGGDQSHSRADSSRAMAEGGEGGEDEIQFLRTVSICFL